MTPVLGVATVLLDLGRGLREAFAMFWETLWALVLGFTLSGAVQAFVSKERMRAKLGGRPKVQDPKKVVTLRLRHSLIEQYQALGPDWRLKMEAALTEALAASPR